ncbi:MAG: hypothetical protein V1740_04695 [Candidatus Woesearchaeota archaeon]
MGEIEELKKLPPEERIKRLKELEDKDKKEIEEARKMIADSEAEAEEDQRKYQDIPVPQMRAIDIGSLFSPEEKEMFKAKRPSEVKTMTDESVTAPIEVHDISLEETVEKESPQLTREQLDRQNEYVHFLATERPAVDIYQGIKEIAQDASNQGYLTREQEGRLDQLYNAAREKNDAFQEGQYQATKTSAQNIAASLDLFHELKKSYIQ